MAAPDPSVLSVVTPTNDGAQLAFTVPADNGSALTKANVGWGDSPENYNLGTSADLPPDSTSYTITGVSTGTHVYAIVAFYNGDGGAGSNEVDFIAEAPVPSVPNASFGGGFFSTRT